VFGPKNEPLQWDWSGLRSGWIIYCRAL